MPLLLAILFFIIMTITDGILGSMKYKSDHRLPKDEMERALGWAEIWGKEWMVRCPNTMPEEVRKESWYRLKMHQHPDKDREWVEKTWPWKYDRFSLPNRKVWDEYWREQSGMYDYASKYPWLKLPDNLDEYGFTKESHMNE